MPGPFSGLSVKLIATIALVIFAVEAVVYVPSGCQFPPILAERLVAGSASSMPARARRRA